MILRFPQLFVYSSFEVDDATSRTQAQSRDTQDDLNIIRTALRRLRGTVNFNSVDDTLLDHLGRVVGNAPQLYFWYDAPNRLGEPQYRVATTRPSPSGRSTDGVQFFPQYPFDNQPRTVTVLQRPYVTLIPTQTYLRADVTAPLSATATSAVYITETIAYEFVDKTSV